MSSYKIFDFDDTLVRTKAKIYVTRADGTKLKLTPGEWVVFHRQKGDQVDLRDFKSDELIDPVGVAYYIKILKNVFQAGGNVIILTARGNIKPVAKFLRSIGIRSGVSIISADSASSMQAAVAKARYIEELIIKRNAESIEFFDDSPLNIQEVEKLKSKYPDINIKTRLVPSYHR